MWRTFSGLIVVLHHNLDALSQNSVFGYSGSKSGVARVRHAVEGDITNDESNFRGV